MHQGISSSLIYVLKTFLAPCFKGQWLSVKKKISWIYQIDKEK
ncbi:hypothetical protein DSOL_3806 [Desulfosporosinus metallidurans]|uniref:Uncharacterized protein n=1 Tax=Desulfosporosinus metallidurans TaxID=1888891 RepID=A0A1Q8QNE4_9FIRM|nr:hypothetical protein DSOL_3806 [Desulfosporosinus metallidurans]